MGMVAYDFEYDGILLSDMGCMLCVIDTSLDQSITVGTDITFNTVKAFGGKHFYSTHTTYESPIEQTYEICKRCDYDSDGFTVDEVRKLTKWLKRMNKHKLKFIGDEFKDFYLEASFNVCSVEKSGKILGLQLNMQANTAYPIHEPIKLSFVSNGDGKYAIKNESDDEGIIYPDAKITVSDNCDVNISVVHDQKVVSNTVIKNCVSGEVITLSYPIISSSVSSHNIADDFNWDFPAFENEYNNSTNTILIPSKCKVQFAYTPAVKVSV